MPVSQNQAVQKKPRQRGIPVKRVFRHMLALNDSELGQFDPIELNLLVAREIPQLSNLKIAHYQSLADKWAAGIHELIERLQGHFWAEPARWENDINFFRLGILCQYLDCDLGIRYREDQR